MALLSYARIVSPTNLVAADFSVTLLGFSFDGAPKQERRSPAGRAGSEACAYLLFRFFLCESQLLS